MTLTRTPEPWWVKPGLAALTLLIFAGALTGSSFIDNDTLRTTMYGTAANGFMLALGYFFRLSSTPEKDAGGPTDVRTNPNQGTKP